MCRSGCTFGLASAARRERAKPFARKTFVFSIDSNRDCLQQSLFEISTLFLFFFTMTTAATTTMIMAAATIATIKPVFPESSLGAGSVAGGVVPVSGFVSGFDDSGVVAAVVFSVCFGSSESEVPGAEVSASVLTSADVSAEVTGAASDVTGASEAAGPSCEPSSIIVAPLLMIVPRR